MRVTEFRKRGMPGIAKLNESDIIQMMELYMVGKNYDEIAVMVRQKKDLIMFMSHKFDWCENRLQMLNTMNNAIVQKVSIAKLESANFLTNLLSMYHKYYNKKVDEYLLSGDDKVIENLRLKPMEKYFKAAELLVKLTTSKDDDDKSKPIANFHIHGDAQISQGANGTVETTVQPSKKLVSAMSVWKREMEKKESDASD